ncbi:MAG: heavy metal translocating P-type ATPase [Methylobacteriaceae bacterium]|nr:heavy metal translocating P-type ATPase [Methylobacteriaceae bacterium]
MNAVSQQARFRVAGMDCASCAAKIGAAVRRVDGVEDVSVSVTAGTMTVRHAPDSDLAELQRRVVSLGYGIAPLAGAVDPPDHSQADEHGRGHTHDDGSCDGHHDHVDHAGYRREHRDGHDHAHRRDHSGGDAAAQAAAATRAVAHGHDHGPTSGPWRRSPKGRLTIASGAALAAAYLIGMLVPGGSGHAFTAAMLVGLAPIARRAFVAARYGAPFSIETLMTTAALGAVVIGASEEAAVVVFLFLIGELLEGVAAGRARASIQSLARLVPGTALIESGGATREVPAESLAVGAIILARPGDRIAADGVIVAGEGAINEAPVTGESVPVAKGPNAQVYAGTVNGDSVLRVRVTAAAADNTIARVVRLVEEAQDSKAPTERIIERFARYYTPAVMVVAALTAIGPPLLTGAAWSAWIYKGLAILLIGCPCALVISVPAAIAASLSAGARRGLLMKGGAVLETVGQVTVACFDKTGTLTTGKPQVTDVLGVGRPEAEVLSIAAAIETGSSHPLATAILDRAAALSLTPPVASDAQAIGGKGMTARIDGVDTFLGSPQAAAARAAFSIELDAAIAAFHDAGKTVAVVVAREQVLGVIALRDEPRADAAAGLAALRAANVRALMLTGDNRRTAEAIGRQLGVEARAELLPDDKLKIVDELKRQGLKVAKIGDGINDAPALAAADVGIAMGGGTDVALETADAAVLHGRVGDVAAMIDMSRRTRANIRQNMAIALGLKAVFLVTTLIGVTGLWPAILADTGATVLVTLNALRLLDPRLQSRS